MPLLFVLACACFIGGLMIRLIDPVVPEIAADLATSQASVSLLASAYAVPYALIQPVLGPVGDLIGKTRVIKICLACLAAASALTVVANSIEVMFAARVLGGLAGGGIIPLALATVGDHVAFEKRQVALSQILTAMIAAVLAGTIGTGFVASLIGWRGAFAIATVLAIAAFVLAMVSLEETRPSHGRRSLSDQLASALEGYGQVFANARAYVCYAGVFVEGVLIFGLLPYIATLLTARGAGGSFEAGMVLAGMAFGGLVYTQLVARLIGRMGGIANLIRVGGVFLAIGFVGVAVQGSWGLEMAAFALLGFGFYSIHNSLQTQATELAPGHRGASVALHAFFFFLGQSAGPVLYAVALEAVPVWELLSAVAIAAFLLSLLLAHALRR
jgi:predicted MFS family arabinose efflux permease